MYAIISNDWKALHYSEAFMNEYIRRAKEWLNAEPGRSMAEKNGSYDWRMASDLEEAGLKEIRLAPDVSDEIKAKLLIEMQENSFKELLNGATVFEYDETEVHPVIYEEEYGGQNIEFEYKPTESGTPDYVHVMTYDPTGEHDDYLDEDHGNYDASTDTYNNSVDYKEVDSSTIREYVIKGSREAAMELIKDVPDNERETIDRYMNFSSASLDGVKDMLELNPDQRKIYLRIFHSYGMPHEKMKHYAETLDEKALDAIHHLNLFAQAHRSDDFFMCNYAWKQVKEMPYLLDFIGGHELMEAIRRVKDPRLFKYIPLIQENPAEKKYIPPIMDDIKYIIEKAVESGDTEKMESIRDALTETGIKVDNAYLLEDNEREEAGEIGL